MPTFKNLCRDYERVEQAIRFVEDNLHRQPPLAEIAAAAELSEYHFQRLFGRWVGISPKRFLQYLTKEHAKQILIRSDTVSDPLPTGSFAKQAFGATMAAVRPGKKPCWDGNRPRCRPCGSGAEQAPPRIHRFVPRPLAR